MKDLLLKHANVIDGRNDHEIINDIDILIQNGIIVKIDKNISSPSAKAMDMKGKYLIPGLINLHSHLPGSGKIGKKQVATLSGLVDFVIHHPLGRIIGMTICKNHAKQNLYSGCTTLRTVGGVSNFDAILRDKINKGKAIGPRLIVANNAVGPERAHMEGTVTVSAKTVKEAVALVEKQIATGADFIKIMITGGILDSQQKGQVGVLKMKPDMVKACCDYAHKQGYKVAAHVEGDEGMIVAIENGVDTIEHGAYADKEHLLAFKNRGGVLVLTLTPAIPLVNLSSEVTGYSNDVSYNSKIFCERMKENAKTCLSLDVPVGLGNDAGCPLVPHYDFWRELVYYNQYIPGVSKQFAIYSATLGNAKILGLDKEIGSIEVNKKADMVVLPSNPLEDLTILKDPCMVLKEGVIYTKKAKKYPSVEQKMSLLKLD